MSGEQYEALLKSLADALIEKDREISLKDYEIERLKGKIAEAERYKNSVGDKPKTIEIR